MMLKNKKQFCRWTLKFNTLPLKLRNDLEKEFIVKAKQYCVRIGLNPDECVINAIKANEIPFSFIVIAK